MKRQRCRSHAQTLADGAGGQSRCAVFDEQPVDGKTMFLRKRAKGGKRGGRFHVSSIIEMIVVCQAAFSRLAKMHFNGAPSLTLLLASLVMAALAACGGAREKPLPPGSIVLVIGDSITAGYGVDATEAWPAQLEKLTGWRVIAAGISGDQTAGGLQRLPALLDEHSPALVIVELGGNDMLRHIPAADITAKLGAMVEKIQARSAKAVLMAAPEPTALGALTGLQAAALYQDLAKRLHVAVIEKALPFVLSDAKLKLDALHPTPAGHRVLAQRAVDELVTIGLVGKR